MKAEKLVKILRQNFGDRVIVNTEYHIQVDSARGKHDIWITKDGDIRYKKAGDRIIRDIVDPQYIVRAIQKTKSKTHVEKMREMLNVARIVQSAEKQAEKVGNGIFTDAGWKDGTARIAAVMVEGDEITARAKTIQCKDNGEAEKAAIDLGLSMGSLIVYNDNKPAVESLNNPKIKWLPRGSNKAADRIGNMRNGQ